jgi:hypothetical protein
VAKVTVHDPPPGVSECVVEIQGSSEQIKAAQGPYMAQQNAPQSEAPGKYQAPSTWSWKLFLALFCGLHSRCVVYVIYQVWESK